MNPNVAGTTKKLGTVLMELGDWQAARAPLSKAIELEPALFKAYYKLAQVDEQSTISRARSSTTRRRSRRGRASSRRTARSAACMRISVIWIRGQVLMEALKVALKGTEEEAQVHHLLGTVLQQQKKYDAAIAEIQARRWAWCRACATRCSVAWLDLHLQGNKEEAKRYLQKFVDVAGAEAPAHYVKAARDKIPETAEGFC